MKKGKYSGKRHHKSVVLMLALVMLLGCVTGGTIAWLTAKSEDVENTFAPSTIGIELKETKNDFKMIPGWTIDKDPIVTVAKGSEDCYVFIVVEESVNLDKFIAYNIDANNWIKLEDAGVDTNETVYYTKYTKRDDVDISIKVLAGGSYGDYTWELNQVLTKPEVTKQMMDELTDNPTLTFTAYASQLYKNNTEEFEPIEAWKNISSNS